MIDLSGCRTSGGRLMVACHYSVTPMLRIVYLATNLIIHM